MHDTQRMIKWIEQFLTSSHLKYDWHQDISLFLSVGVGASFLMLLETVMVPESHVEEGTVHGYLFYAVLPSAGPTFLSLLFGGAIFMRLGVGLHAVVAKVSPA